MLRLSTGPMCSPAMGVGSPTPSPSAALAAARRNEAPASGAVVGSYRNVSTSATEIQAEMQQQTTKHAPAFGTSRDTGTVTEQVLNAAGTPRKRKPGRPRTSEGHKHRQLQEAARKVALERLSPPVLIEWRHDLVADLGGEDRLSTQQLAIVDLAVRDKLLLDSLDAWLFAQPSIVNKRSRKLLPVVMERARLADGLQRRLELLGMARVQATKMLDASAYAHGEVKP